MTGGHRRLRVTVLVALVACLTVGLLVPATALAGDNAATFTFESEQINQETNELVAEPGETVTVEFVVGTHGDLMGDGVDELSATIAYDTDVFTVTDVEDGPMLAAGDDDAEVNGSTTIDDEQGTISIEQERDPSGDGVKTTDTAATITFEVADDPAMAESELEITDSTAMVVTGHPQASFERDLDVSIEDTDGDDTVPGFGLPAVLAALAAALWFSVRRE